MIGGQTGPGRPAHPGSGLGAPPWTRPALPKASRAHRSCAWTRMACGRNIGRHLGVGGRVREPCGAGHPDRGDASRLHPSPARGRRCHQGWPHRLRSARPLGGRPHRGPGSRHVREVLLRAGRLAAPAGPILAAPAGPIGGFPAQPLGARRIRGRDALHRGTWAFGRGGHRHLPRRRAHLGVRTSAVCCWGSVPVGGGRLDVFDVIAQPAGHPRPRRRRATSSRPRAATPRGPSPPTPSAPSPAASARRPSSIPLQVTARERGGRSVTAQRQPGRRAPARVRCQPLAGCAARCIAGPGQRDPQLRAGHDVDVLPGEARGAKEADRLL